MCCDVCPCKAIKEGGECWLDDENVENKPESNEHYYVIKRKCIGCGRCKNVCPVANIELEEE
jgi:formate hydrogenlyase subunit 6/NADH:ubiquinone oxidoreductase subunit I